MRIKVKDAVRYTRRNPGLEKMTAEERKKWEIERLNYRFK